MIYSKICVICQKKFFAMKVNKIYCSKTCSNRTRYLPRELVISLVQRNARFAMKANRYVASVITEDGSEEQIGSSIPEESTKDNPLGKDHGLLVALAKMELQKRKEQAEKEELERKRSLESECGFAVVEKDNNGDIKDISSELFVSDNTVDSIILNDNDDQNSIQDNQEVADNNTTKKYKIRKIGGS
jgi:hypothetical protein